MGGGGAQGLLRQKSHEKMTICLISPLVKVVQTSFQNCKLEHLQKVQHGLDHIIGAQTRLGGVDGS